MTEEYVGLKFNVVFEKKEPILSSYDKLIIKTARELEILGVSPNYGEGNAGNISIRYKDGFIITPTGCHYENMTPEDLVYVRYVDVLGKEVFVNGLKEPSSETIMHYMIYRNKPYVKTIVHGHDDIITKKVGEFPHTNCEYPYGSIELAEAASEIGAEFFILINHGFVAVGTSIENVMVRIHSVVVK